jgi:hypothetical protein
MTPSLAIPPNVADTAANINLDNPALNLYTDKEIWWIVRGLMKEWAGGGDLKPAWLRT